MYKCIKSFKSINGKEYIEGTEIFFSEYGELGYGETLNFILAEEEETVFLQHN